VWNDGLLRFAFWSLNTGLLLMVTLSLLPVGLMQTWASVTHGYWYARSAEFLQTPTLQFFRWLRVLGDTVFSAGAVALIVFVFSLARRRVVPEPAVPRTQPAVVS
jgi:nitric oxide reductase subunit B